MARPASGDPLSDAKAKAAAIEAQLTQAQNQMSALSQQYDAAEYHLSQINGDIQKTKAAIAQDEQQVAHSKEVLSKAAVATYISSGTAAAQNPIFASNDKTLGAQTQYSQIATGDISLAVAKLHTAEKELGAKQAELANEQSQAQQQVTIEQNAMAQNQQAINSQKNALAQEQGQIATLVQQQEQAAAAAAAKAAQQRQAAAAAAASAAKSAAPASGGSGSPSAPSTSANVAATPGPQASAPPPSAPGGAGAVQAAESQIGVPYVWGGETPGVGFDCSGLTAWAWGQVGVSLPHFSGGQMADTAPVPVNALQPGDLLFYGPGGSDHVAMYVGPGTMIEAPYTGASVRITGLRLSGGFVGAGRP